MGESVSSIGEQIEAIRKRQDEQEAAWTRIREIDAALDECGNISKQDYNERGRLHRRAEELRHEDEMYMDSDYRVMLDELAALREQVDALTRERDAALERLNDVRDSCLSALSYPDAHYSENYIYQAYEPYDEILAIVDPPPDNPDLVGCYEAWSEYMKNWQKGRPIFDYREWKAHWLATPSKDE